jgi:hypothetical protein
MKAIIAAALWMHIDVTEPTWSQRRVAFLFRGNMS